MTGSYGNYGQQPTPPLPPFGYQPPPRKSRWPWIIGAIVVAVVVVVVAVLAIIGYVVSHSTDSPVSTMTVTYQVTGTGKAEVQYYDARGSMSAPITVDLPWQTQVTMPTTVMPYVSANRASAGPEIACRISSGESTINERKSVSRLVYCARDPDKP